MPFYSIIDISFEEVNFSEKDVIKNASRLVKKHGGEYVSRSISHEVLESSRQKPEIVIIILWKFRENAISFIEDLDYKALVVNERNKGSKTNHLLLESKDDLLFDNNLHK